MGTIKYARNRAKVKGIRILRVKESAVARATPAKISKLAVAKRLWSVLGDIGSIGSFLRFLFFLSKDKKKAAFSDKTLYMEGNSLGGKEERILCKKQPI